MRIEASLNKRKVRGQEGEGKMVCRDVEVCGGAQAVRRAGGIVMEEQSNGWKLVEVGNQKVK
tara:strand:+ start:2699 stop:2884 length:186 start_codon:yes stop_codon:yes gene_type:complete